MGFVRRHVMVYRQDKNDDARRMTWICGDRTTIDSAAFPSDAVDAVKRLKGEYATLTESRIVGMAIEFHTPQDDYLTDREREVETDLQREHGIDFPARYSFAGSSQKENYWEDAIRDDGFDAADFNMSSDTQRYKITVPTHFKTRFDEYVDELDGYHRRNKMTLLGGMVLSFTLSWFTDRMERVRTKDQILRSLNGESIKESRQTDPFEKLDRGTRDPQWSEISSKLNEDDPTMIEQESGLVVDVKKLNINDTVEINPQDLDDAYKSTNTDDHPLPQSSQYRLPLMMAVVRSMVSSAEEKVSWARVGEVKYNCNRFNADYDTDGYMWTQLKEHLEIREYDGNDYVWVYEEEVPAVVESAEAERKSTLSDMIKKLIGNENSLLATQREKRSLEGAFGNCGFDYDPDGFIAGGQLDTVTMMQTFSEDELWDIAEYLAGGYDGYDLQSKFHEKLAASQD